MIYIAVILSALVAGIIHSATGFGAGIFMMLFFPSLFGMISAPAVSSTVVMGLEAALAWKFRKYIDWKSCMLPTLVYMVLSWLTIQMVKTIDLDMLTVGYGVFLVALAIYFFVFSSRMKFQANWKSATVCAVISGVASGFFGIGGPLMAVYFVSATDSKERYVANLQFVFTVTSVTNLAARIANGIYTADLLPFTALGLVGILLGEGIGLKILNRLDANTTKRVVYAFVGLSGVITVAKQLI